MILHRGLTPLFWRTQPILPGTNRSSCKFYHRATERCKTIFFSQMFLFFVFSMQPICNTVMFPPFSPVNWMDFRKSSLFNWWMMDNLKKVRKLLTALFLCIWDKVIFLIFCDCCMFRCHQINLGVFPLRLLTWPGVSAFRSCKEAPQRTANICTHDQRQSDWITYYWGKSIILVNLRHCDVYYDRYSLILFVSEAFVLEY